MKCMKKCDQNEIQVRVTQIVTEQLKLNEQVNWDCSFQELGADSLDMVELIIKFEDSFQVMINDEVANNLNRLADVVAYLS